MKYVAELRQTHLPDAIWMWLWTKYKAQATIVLGSTEDSIFCLLSQALLKCQLCIWIASSIESAHCVHVLLCKNTTVISVCLIKPLRADFSAQCNQEKLNGILPKWRVCVYCSSSVVKSPPWRSFGHISDLISHYSETHVSGSQQQRLEWGRADGCQTILASSLVSANAQYLLKERALLSLSWN